MNNQEEAYLIFGPVLSRRLGRSLGINNIPIKHCSYSCVYCQIGYIGNFKPIKTEFFKPNLIINALKAKIQENPEFLNDVDYITIVPDGEPTLDKNLGKLIQMLKQFNKPLAILTNGSMLWKKDVKNDLLQLDLVSIKVDSIQEKNWRFINNPNEYLDLEKILTGIRDFAIDFKGKLVTETMLIENIDYDFEKIAKFLANLKNLHKSYITIPTRPPTFPWVRPVKESVVNKCLQIFSDVLGKEKVGLLLGPEGNNFYFSGDVIEDILSITTLHPIKESTLKKILIELGFNWKIVEDLIAKDQLVKIPYNNNYFYLRKMRTKSISNIA